MSLTKARTVVS